MIALEKRNYINMKLPHLVMCFTAATEDASCSNNCTKCRMKILTNCSESFKLVQLHCQVYIFIQKLFTSWTWRQILLLSFSATAFLWQCYNRTISALSGWNKDMCEFEIKFEMFWVPHKPWQVCRALSGPSSNNRPIACLVFSLVDYRVC